MMRLDKAFLLACVLTAVAGAARSEIQPRSVQTDERIRTVPFQRDNIVYLAGMMGVSTMIVFNEDERIATVAMGDTVGWQAVPDQSKQFLFIKPLEPNAVTNMNVVTTKRVYTFMLTGAKPGNTRTAVIKLRFSYPEDAGNAKLLAAAKENAAMPNLKAALANPNGLNYDYGYRGAVDNRPTSVFDDGKKTFFQFSGELPAFFAVKADGRETLVNFRQEGDYIVIDKVSAQWTLRNGDVVTCVFKMKKTTQNPVVMVGSDHHGASHER
ncbi:UNVERIFIED_ORG: type IV secretion system protein VirB9 [Agrobacterium larrymoorei]|uniref:Conjugal transfer protein n=2 Tax=Rhizobium/Agrobacterium group TaxID=227290 RepID=A0AA92H7H4_RHIRH|nr:MULTISPECIES: TrbG/VirB9 family P-type conjugative transfer protein [Rhizobium/Agrobacterium group]MDP9573830.1 type IV secretion system protein VirB9 [Agrobacterium larrymoorei]PVE62582.1 conjugal transfer protein [Agrobacterium tumefaciens]PVE70720.1 conjugal transfer protein [Sphingomonas sp. TPD3009]PVE50157.1 conjugal transfer protein [Rhizobium rhizogenes]TBN14818.1 conjugal transfer protein [Agrobacterium cavarae]